MSFDYSKLAGKIKEKFDTQSNFAEAMEMSERSLSLKMNGLRGWKQTEIEKARQLLSIDVEDLHKYFFTPKVQC